MLGRNPEVKKVHILRQKVQILRLTGQILGSGTCLWGVEGNSKVKGADFEVKKQIVRAGADFGAKKGNYLLSPKHFSVHQQS